MRFLTRFGEGNSISFSMVSPKDERIGPSRIGSYTIAGKWLFSDVFPQKPITCSFEGDDLVLEFDGEKPKRFKRIEER
jgi:hypothetical protein